MTKVTGLDNCGNAPKQLIFTNALVSYFTSDTNNLADMEWQIVGQGVSETDISSVNFEHVLSHGKYASADGRVNVTDQKSYDFMAVGEFSGHTKEANLTYIKVSVHDITI